MEKNPWPSEYFKLALLIASIIILGSLTGYWLPSFSLGVSLYIGHYLYKLRQIYRWLNSDLQNNFIPNAYGVLGCIIELIYSHKKNLEQQSLQRNALFQQLHNIVSAIPSATVILDEQHHIIWANLSALPVLQIDAQQDQGIKIEHLIRQAAFSEFLQTPSKHAQALPSPLDDNKTLLMQWVPYSENKKLLIAQDISQQSELRKVRKQFVANASHELRTPLTVIAGYLEYLHSDPKLPANLQTPVISALEQTDAMAKMITDLLLLSNLDAKEVDPTKLTRIDVSNHLNKLHKMLTANHSLDQHDLILQLPKEDLSIDIIEQELDSLCLNLLNNAIQYTPAHKSIHAGWRRAGNELLFFVEDEGLGIAAQHIARLTERFYRVDDGRSRRQGGTGLGLSIVKSILERYQGRLEISSHEHYGSTFSVYLPLTLPVSLSIHTPPERQVR